MIFGYIWNDPYNHVKIGMKDGANNVRGGNMMMMMISMAMIVMIKRG